MRVSKTRRKHLLVSIFTTTIFLHGSKKQKKYKTSLKIHIYGFEGPYGIIIKVKKSTANIRSRLYYACVAQQ